MHSNSNLNNGRKLYNSRKILNLICHVVIKLTAGRYFLLTKKKLCFFAILSLSPFLVFANAINQSSIDMNSIPLSTANESAISILNEMKKAVVNSDYEISFISQDTLDYPNSFHYKYIGSNGKNQANLLYLEGVSKEIILHDNMVSYFQTDRASFSIPAHHIMEVFPDVIYGNFDEITKYYDFVLLGKGRTANSSCKLIRIVPKDKDRYNYVIWIDEETHLPLKIDLLDLDSKIIHQTKVLALNLSFDKELVENYINNKDYPTLLSVDKEDNEIDKWSPTWLPKGFKNTATYNINYENENIDTQLFSDGVFTFTINVSQQASDQSSYISKQGPRAVYSINLDNMNIVIVGDLPVDTIEKIAANIKLK